jgi:hypothetical protein
MLQAYVSSISGVSDVCFKCFMWILHMSLWLYTYVLSVCFECFRCSKLMLQMFHLNVAKVDLKVACYYGYTRMFQAYGSSVSYVSDVCCKYFICIFKKRSQGDHMLQLHVAAAVWVTICFKSMLLLLRGSTCRRGSPCRLGLHACGRVTTLGATARSPWVIVCFKSMLLLRGS